LALRKTASKTPNTKRGVEFSTSRAFSIVIPAFNEETGLRAIVPSLVELANVIVVDDGSTDGTRQVAAEAGARVLRQPYNQGYGASIKRGIREATGEIVVIMDADGQHNPDDIARLLERIGEYDMVVGARTAQSHTEPLRHVGKRILVWLAQYLVNQKIPDLNSGFRAFRRERATEFIHILPNGFSVTTTLTLAFMKAGYSVGYIPIETTARVGRKSSVSFLREGLQTALLITRVIMLFNPLKVIVPPSLTLLLVGTIYALWGIALNGHIPSGALLSILAGIVILFFGLLSDQISIIVRSKR
jgi:glycosyltransferase involved in cell wall biosynthesis